MYQSYWYSINKWEGGEVSSVGMFQFYYYFNIMQRYKACNEKQMMIENKK